MGRKADEIEALTETWSQIAGGRIVEREVSYRQAVRILAQRLAMMVSPGDDKRPYVQVMLRQGYRRATAYRVVNTAFERAAERIARTGAPPQGAGPKTSLPPPTSGTPNPVTAPAPAPPPASVPVAPLPMSPGPRERYRADALERKALRGENAGGRVYGYRNVWVLEDGRRVIAPGGAKKPEAVARTEYEIDPQEAGVLRGVFRAYADGHGTRSIARALNGDPGGREIARRYFGGETPAPPWKGTRSWAPSSLREMLFRERYRGNPLR